MNILLVCAGGYSTSILVNKVKKYAQENQREIAIQAVGKGEYEAVAKDYDVILVAPQIKYHKAEIAEKTKKPVVGIPAADYGAGKPERLIALAEEACK